jgi:protein disulfide-isomerase
MTTAPKFLHLLFFALSVTVATAAEHPYNETTDAKADIKQAEATATNKPLVLVFGANWCPDCLALNKAMTQGASAKLLSQDFRIVKVDVGHFDKNKDVAESYGVPLKKGIPTVAIVSPKNEVLYVTKEGELSNARRMSDDGIYQFFKRVTAPAKTK